MNSNVTTNVTIFKFQNSLKSLISMFDLKVGLLKEFDRRNNLQLKKNGMSSISEKFLACTTLIMIHKL